MLRSTARGFVEGESRQSREMSNNLMFDHRTPLDVFLDATAARQPTPGGGSIAALTGRSSAIGEMVVNYSVGKKGLEAFSGELKPVLTELHRARQLMLSLMVEDQIAYDAVSARKLWKALRSTRRLIRRRCGVHPYSAGNRRHCPGRAGAERPHHQLRQLPPPFRPCCLCRSCHGDCPIAVYNVRVNLKELTPAERQHIESTTTQVLSRAASIIQRVSPRIWQRYDQGV